MTRKVGSLSQASSPDTPLEALLLQSCVAGSERAWTVLHRRHYSTVAAFLRKLGVGSEELEDAAQEVFVQVFRYLSRFRGESELQTWLYRLCITQARKCRRRVGLTRALQRMLSMAPEQIAPSGPGWTEAAAARRIEAALSQLGEKDRVVFVLYELESVSGKRIAEILECPEATVWRRLHYARKRFEEALHRGLSANEEVGQ